MSPILIAVIPSLGTLLASPLGDLAVFALCAGVAWLLLRRRSNAAAATFATDSTQADSSRTDSARTDSAWTDSAGPDSDWTAGQSPFEVDTFLTANTASGRPLFPSIEMWLRRHVLLARIPLSWSSCCVGVVAVSGTIAAMTFVATENAPLAVAASLLTLGLLMVILLVVAQRNVRQFRQQLPLAMDIMAGAIQSGDNIRQTIGLLSNTMQEPARTEFIRCRNQLEMGLSLRDTMQSLSDRICTIDVQLFATTLATHRDTGGHLAATLRRMGRVIHSRFDYERHLRTTTGMGRMSVIVVIALAWILMGYIVAVKPDYGRDMLTDPLGQRMLMLALALEFIGIGWSLFLVRANY